MITATLNALQTDGSSSTTQMVLLCLIPFFSCSYRTVWMF